MCLILYTFFRLFINQSIHSPVHSLIHLLAHSFIHSFSCSFFSVFVHFISFHFMSYHVMSCHVMLSCFVLFHLTYVHSFISEHSCMHCASLCVCCFLCIGVANYCLRVSLPFVVLCFMCFCFIHACMLLFVSFAHRPRTLSQNPYGVCPSQLEGFQNL